MNTDKQKATLNTGRISNGRMLDGEKEQICAWAVVARKDGRFEQPVTVRVWMARSRGASTVYASVWAHGRAFSMSGHGKAGGYGYCRRSAAVAAAISSAGIRLSQDIAGRGESAIESALDAIARAMGYRVFAIVSL